MRIVGYGYRNPKIEGKGEEDVWKTRKGIVGNYHLREILFLGIINSTVRDNVSHVLWVNMSGYFFIER